MKNLKTLVLTSLLALAASLLATPRARAEVNFSFFYDSLSPYGDWVQTDDYGYVWHPGDRDPDWRPYSDGYWADTDAGWTWVSYEDYGGVVYHYGRWVDLDGPGWVWVPGNDWGPGWVSWRSSDSYVGWAPLPPRARFNVEIGFGFGVDRDYDIGPGYYNFCNVRDFGAPDLRPVIFNRERNVTIVNETTNITNITVNKNTNIVHNGGPNVNLMRQKSARPIQRLNLVRDTKADGRGKDGLRARKDGNNLVMPAPTITRNSEDKIAPKKVAQRLGKTRADNGWNKVSDADQQKVRQKFQADAGRKRDERSDATPDNPVVNPAAAEKRADRQSRQGEKVAAPAEKKERKLQPFLPEGDRKAAAAEATERARADRQVRQPRPDQNDDADRAARRQQREAQEQQAARAARRQAETVESARGLNRANREPDVARAPRQTERPRGEGGGQQNSERAARQQQQQQAARQQQRQAERAPAKAEKEAGEGKRKKKDQDEKE